MQKYLRKKIMRWFDSQEKKNDYLTLMTQKREEARRTSFYYFKNRSY
jgi:hypothetical protein